MKTKHFFYCLLALAVFFSACKPDKEEPEIPIPVTGITLNYAELTLLPKDTITLIATVQPDNADNKTVMWTSSNPAVAIVNNNGFVEAIANGETTITATTEDGNKKAACMVIVGTFVTGITLNYAELTLIPKDTITLIAAVQPDNADNKTVTWTSSNPAVAIVNNNGFVETLTKGKTTITATTQDGDKKATCMITVKDYRSQWVGDWDFVTDGSEYYLGTISYGAEYDVIIIDYSKQITRPISVKIDESGELLRIIGDYAFLYIEGKFEGKKKIHFKLIEHSMGGGDVIFIVDGIKKEGDKK